MLIYNKNLDNFKNFAYNINKSVIEDNNKIFYSKRIRGWCKR